MQHVCSYKQKVLTKNTKSMMTCSIYWSFIKSKGPMWKHMNICLVEVMLPKNCNCKLYLPRGLQLCHVPTSKLPFECTKRSTMFSVQTCSSSWTERSSEMLKWQQTSTDEKREEKSGWKTIKFTLMSGWVKWDRVVSHDEVETEEIKGENSQKEGVIPPTPSSQSDKQ